MRCEDCRETVSAHLDGRPEPDAWPEAEAHLRTCLECAAYLEASEQVQRLTRLRPAEDVPDLTPRVLAAAGISRRADDPSLPIRIVLACTAALQLAMAVPALVLGDDANLPVHYARHLGSIDVALAIGFLWVAWRPGRALSGVLPVVAALVACHIGSSVVDVINHRAVASSELLNHVPEIVGLTALWLLTPRPIHARARA
jgi:predicted anti-sigma-YlaC factor YlaD